MKKRKTKRNLEEKNEKGKRKEKGKKRKRKKKQNREKIKTGRPNTGRHMRNFVYFVPSAVNNGSQLHGQEINGLGLSARGHVRNFG